MGEQHNLRRVTVPNSRHKVIARRTCHWCGRKPDRLYRYGQDAARLFCNVQCYLIYHNKTRKDYDYVELGR